MLRQRQRTVFMARFIAPERHTVKAQLQAKLQAKLRRCRHAPEIFAGGAPDGAIRTRFCPDCRYQAAATRGSSGLIQHRMPCLFPR